MGPYTSVLAVRSSIAIPLKGTTREAHPSWSSRAAGNRRTFSGRPSYASRRSGCRPAVERTWEHCNV